MFYHYRPTWPPLQNIPLEVMNGKYTIPSFGHHSLIISLIKWDTNYSTSNICVAILWNQVEIRGHWLWVIARKMNKFLLFSSVLRILQLLIALELLVQFRWRFQQNVQWALNQTENWKCHMFYFRLISQDCITSYICIWFMDKQNECCTDFISP